jgi:hypothetical protein
MSSRGKGTQKRLYIILLPPPSNFLMLGEVRLPVADFEHHQNAMKLIERNVQLNIAPAPMDILI